MINPSETVSACSVETPQQKCLRKIFVGGLSATTDNNSLHSHFESCGEIEEATVIYYHGLERSRGFGFVLFVNAESVEEAMRQCPHIIDDKEVEIKRAFPKIENLNENSDKKKRRHRKKKKLSSQSYNSLKTDHKNSDYSTVNSHVPNGIGAEPSISERAEEPSCLHSVGPNINPADMSYFQYVPQPFLQRQVGPSQHLRFSTSLSDVHFSMGSRDPYVPNQLPYEMNPVRYYPNNYRGYSHYSEEPYQRDLRTRHVMGEYDYSDKSIFSYVPYEHMNDYMNTSNQRSRIDYYPDQTREFGMTAYEYPPSFSSVLRGSTHKRYY